MKDVLIIGAGTAGLTAAIYASRAGLSVTVFEGNMPGGKIVSTPKIENYPGMPGVSGYDYAQALLGQARDFGAEIVYETVRQAELRRDPKVLITAENEYEGKTVIIANGAARKRAGFKGEREFEGRGVSYCATCDGNFFREKKVIVLGGGETAVEDAAYLSELASFVTVVSNSTFEGNEKAERLLSGKENVRLVEYSTVTEVAGEGVLEEAVLKERDGSEERVPADGIFVAVGIAPDNGFMSEEIVLDRNGYIAAGEDTVTAVPGVYAAGDTRRKNLRQLVTAASDGANAAAEAIKYIKNPGKE